MEALEVGAPCRRATATNLCGDPRATCSHQRWRLLAQRVHHGRHPTTASDAWRTHLLNSEFYMKGHDGNCPSSRQAPRAAYQM